MNRVDRPGTFKGQIIESSIVKNDSGSVQFCAKIMLLSFWDSAAKEWIDWQPYEVVEDAYVTLVKTDGEINEVGVKQVCGATGWNGADFSALNGFASSDGHQCKLTIKQENYKGQETLRVKWIDDANTEGPSLKALDADGVKALNNMYASKLRALSGAGVKPSVVRTPAPAAKKF